MGIAGERITNNYKFYAVFQENIEYSVRSGSEELGTIVKPPPAGEKIAIAGHVWIVEEVDHKRRLVYCEQIKGKVPAYFGDCPGDINTKIILRMRDVLREDKKYPYLMKNAVARLSQARLTARNSGVIDQPLICLGGNMWCLFPWLGTYSFMALERFLKIKCAGFLGLKGMDSAKPYYIQFTMSADEKTFYELITSLAKEPINPLELVYPKEVPLFEKYDEMLPESLVIKGFAFGVLDIDGMLKRVKEWERFIPEKIDESNTGRIESSF